MVFQQLAKMLFRVSLSLRQYLTLSEVVHSKGLISSKSRSCAPACALACVSRVIQALRHLGEPHVDDRGVNTPSKGLSRRDKRQLSEDLRFAPSWVAGIMRRIASGDAANSDAPVRRLGRKSPQWSSRPPPYGS
jgi:hypothetical protein